MSASVFVDKLQDSKEQLLPPGFDQAASRAGVWSKRIAATTALAAIAITLTYVTKAAWLVVALAFAGQVISFQRWWHYTNVMTAVGDKAISKLLSEDGTAIQTPTGNGFRGFIARHPTALGVALGIILAGILIGVVFGRHYL